jgi:hypothetical protein
VSDPNDETLQSARARRGRNYLLAGSLLVFVVLVFVITMVKIKANGGFQ